MTRPRRVIATAIVVSATAMVLALLPLAPPAAAATPTVTLNVDRIDDVVGVSGCLDAVPNDCSLRGATNNANADGNSEVERIVVPAGTYVLTTPGTGSAGGSLKLSNNAVLEGAGAGETIIDANASERSIVAIASQWIESLSMSVSGVTLRNGNTCAGASDSFGSSDGAGIFIAGWATLTDVVVENNKTCQSGGGIHVGGAASTVTLDHVVVRNNQAAEGGGVASLGHLTTIDSTIDGNTSASGGGGARIAGTADFIRTTISNNIAARPGGGIDTGDDTTTGCCAAIIRMINSTVSGNLAKSWISGTPQYFPGAAGGIHLKRSRLLLRHSTITDNTAASQAVGNQPGRGGALATGYNSEITIENSILTGNHAQSDCGIDQDATLTGSVWMGCGGLAGDPLLGPLADNGGPTLTHSIPAGSPAANVGDAGDCEGVDQRGFTRSVGASCDLGAFEAGATDPTTTTTTSTSTTSTSTTSTTTTPPPDTVTGTVEDVIVNEGDGSGGVVLTLSGPAPVTANYEMSVVGGGADVTGYGNGMTVYAGDTTAGFGFDIVDDDIDEPNENFTVVVDGGGSPRIDIIDGSAKVTIVDNDDPAPPPTGDDGAAAALAAGLDDLSANLPGWLARFNLDDAPPIITPDLADLYQLQSLVAELHLPTIDSTDTLGELADALEAAECTIDHVAGDGTAGPADLIQARCTRTLDDLDRDDLVDAADDGVSGLLDQLVSTTGLDASGAWDANLAATFVLGVDTTGFYLGTDSGFDLDLGGELAVSGDGTSGPDPLSFDGDAAVLMTASVHPDVAAGTRLRSTDLDDDLDDLLRVAVEGGASADLDLALTDQLHLGWHGAWTVTTGDDGLEVTTTEQTLIGHLVLPELLDGEGDPSQVELTATLTPEGWHVTGGGTLAVGTTLGGFGLKDVAVDLMVTDDGITGTVTGTVHVVVDTRTFDVDVTIRLHPDSIEVDGSIALDDLTIPSLLYIDGATLEIHLDIDDTGVTGDAIIDGSSGVAIVLPGDPDSVGAEPAGPVRLVGFFAHIDSGGNVTLTADEIHGDIGNGSITFDVSPGTASDPTTISVGPDVTGPLLSVPGVLELTIPSLNDLKVDVTGLTISRTGVVGASTVVVHSADLLESIALGGILPFKVTTLTVDFPDHDDLSDFDVAVDGNFDFSAFADLPFTPILSVGGTEVEPPAPGDPPANPIHFSVRIENDIVTPLDVADITFGFEDLRLSSDVVLGADITLGGFVNGEFQNDACGHLSIEDGIDNPTNALSTEACGTITPTADGTRLDIGGEITFSGRFGSPSIDVDDLTVDYGLIVEFADGELTVDPSLQGVGLGKISIPVGDLMKFTAEHADINFDPGPDEYLATFGAGGLGVEFADLGPFSGWTGHVENFAVNTDFEPVALDGFSVDVHNVDGHGLGLPEYLPLTLDGMKLTFPSVTAGEPLDISGMRLSVSGGLNIVKDSSGAVLFPVAAKVHGLEIDLHKLVNGEFPISNLDAISLGVAPFEIAGMEIGGIVEIGRVEVHPDQWAFYLRVTGTFTIGGIGAGIDLVLTEFGPVVAEVTAPVGFPIGPTGLVLANVKGGVLFGQQLLPNEVPADPQALLSMPLFQQLGDFDVNADTIASFVTQAVDEHVPTFLTTATLSLTGVFTHIASPVLVNGNVTVAATLGKNTFDLLSKGELTVMGIPLGLVGTRSALSDPLNPKYQFAFATPPPGSLLSFLLPSQSTSGATLDTTGLVKGTALGAAAFVQAIASGSLTQGAAFINGAMDDLAASLDADRVNGAADDAIRKLTRAVLDVDGNHSISTAENVVITRTLLLSRLATLFADDTGALANVFLIELTSVAIDPDTAPASIAAEAQVAFDAAMAIFRQAVRDAGAAFLAQADPSLTIIGKVQPVILGVPIGSPTDTTELRISKSGITLGVQTSISRMVNTLLEQSTLGLASIWTRSLGGIIGDAVTVVAELPLGGIFESIIQNGVFPNFDSAAVSWGVTIEGALTFQGLKVAELSGLLVPPNNRSFVDAHSQKLYLPGAVFDPADPLRVVPLATTQQYENLVSAGGLIITGDLAAPELLTDPAAVISRLNLTPPTTIAGVQPWLQQFGTAVNSTVSPGFLQIYLPPPNQFAKSHLIGQWNAKILSIPLAQGSLQLTTAGLEVHGKSFGGVVDVTGVIAPTTTINGPLGPFQLPAASIDVSVSAAVVNQMLANIGVPSQLRPPNPVSWRLRAFSPGFAPASAETIQRVGGVELSGKLAIPNIVSSMDAKIALAPNGDFTATGSVSNLNLAGVSIPSATVRVTKVGGTIRVNVDGAGTLMGNAVTVSGSLNPNGTGTLAVTLTGGTPVNLDGFTINAGFSLNFTNSGVTLSFGGNVGLPSWLSSAVGLSSVAATGTFNSAGEVDLALSGITGLKLEASNALRLQPVNGTTFLRLRRTSAGVVSLLVGGNLSVANSGLPLLSATGTFSTGGTTLGSADITVALGGAGLSLGGFVVTGSARIQGALSNASINIQVNGALSVAGAFTAAAVTGAIGTSGITSLSVQVAGSDTAGLRLGFPGVSLTSRTLTLTRTALSPLTYRLDVAATGSITGVVTGVNMTGSLDTNGYGTLTIGASTINLFGGATITGATFTLVRNGSGVTVGGGGTFAMLSRSFTVSGRIVLTSTGPSGSLSLALPAPGLDLGLGLRVTGTFTLGVSNAGAGSVQFGVANGSVTFPGTARTVTVNGNLSTAGLGSLTVTYSGGALRLGTSPFTVNGAFTLSRTATVTEFRATNATFDWPSVGAFTVTTFVMRSDGLVNVVLPPRAIALPGGSTLSLGALNFLMDAGALNGRLSVGASTLAVPGITTFTVPAFAVSTADFTVGVSGTVAFGSMALTGAFTFVKSGSVFSVRVQAGRVRISDTYSVDVPTFSLASDGTFSVDGEKPRFGASNLALIGDRFTFAKTGTALSNFSASLTNPRAVVPIGAPISLGSTITIGSGAAFSRSLNAGVNLGRLFNVSSGSYTVGLSAGVLSLKLNAGSTPTVSALAGSANMKVTAFEVRSDLALTAKIEGQLGLFGYQLASNDFNVSLAGGKLTMDMQGAASLPFGFLTVNVDGTYDSTGDFHFSGSTNVGFPTASGCPAVVGFEASLAVSVDADDGIGADASVTICALGGQGTASGHMDSRGVISASVNLRIPGTTTSVFSGGFEFDLGSGVLHLYSGSTVLWSWDLKTGGTSAGAKDTDPPDFSPNPPPNQTFTVTLLPGETKARINFTLPAATDSPNAASTVMVSCDKAAYSQFSVGTTLVTCEATDRAGLTRTGSFNVVVNA